MSDMPYPMSYIQMTVSRCCDRSPVWREERRKKKKNLFRVVGNLLLPPSQDICEAADQLDNLRSKQDVAEITPTMKRDS